MGKHTTAGDAPGGQDTIERGWIALALTLWGDHRPPEWHTRAACRGSGPDLWEDGPKICAGCPVRRECQVDAEAWETTMAGRITDVTGIVAGETPRQRIHRYVQNRFGVRISG